MSTLAFATDFSLRGSNHLAALRGSKRGEDMFRDWHFCLIWPAGSIWKGREDKRLLTCRAHSPDLDNLNTMWVEARRVWFLKPLLSKGSSSAWAQPMSIVIVCHP